MGDIAPAIAMEFQIGPKGRSVLPALVRRAAGLAEGDRVIARAEGPGRVVLETAEAVQQRVWAAAPAPRGVNVVADVRALRDEDNAIADANFARRSANADADSAEAIGARLLAELGM